MNLPFDPPLPPMEALTAERLPEGGRWWYEPKWDGFRCLVFRDGAGVELQSKASKPLTRYFPEVVAAVRRVPARRFVLDAELVIAKDGRLEFDRLLQRIHPAESRVRTLAAADPATLLVFDLLATGARTSLLSRPQAARRAALEGWAVRQLRRPDPGLALSPGTPDVERARGWLRTLSGVDGVVAKDAEEPYRSGERAGMVKVKRMRTADCVVGGLRRSSGGRGLASMLLGLYDDAGLLHHVGFTSSFPARDRPALLAELEPLAGPPGFTGRAPGGPSRWSRGRESEWTPLRPVKVVEVRYDHFSGDRFRHGTTFLRWRPDKAPAQCTFEQVRRTGPGALDLLAAGDAGE